MLGEEYKIEFIEWREFETLSKRWHYILKELDNRNKMKKKIEKTQSIETWIFFSFL